MKPYYTDDLVTLYHGDCRELLPDLDLLLDPLEADLIVTDPPYGETALGWDTWPADWPELLSAYSYAMWCFGSMRMFLEQREAFNGWWRYSQDVVWEKHNGSNFHNDRFRRVHEHAVFWFQGNWNDRYHKPPTTSDATARVVRRKGKIPHFNPHDRSIYVSKDGGPRIQRSVIYAPSMHGRAINETEKPVPVLEQLIEYGCRPGGLVLDPFAGSASTLIAARNTGRRAIGIELREEQCARAAQRLSQGVLTFDGGAA